MYMYHLARSLIKISIANINQVPQISYASTSPDLSFKDRFPFFSRVLPSDTLQAEAMANLVYELDWNYIATIKEVGNFGGIDSFNTFARAKSIRTFVSYNNIHNKFARVLITYYPLIFVQEYAYQVRTLCHRQRQKTMSRRF